MTWNWSFGRYVFLSMKVYCYRPDENIEIPLNHLLLTVCYWNIGLFIWVYNKALINRDLGPYEKYLFWRSRRMDLTAFGPYALNVRTNISSYGPRAPLIRAYYWPIVRSIRENIWTAVLKYEPNEVTSVRKAKIKYFPVWTELIGQ